MKSGKFKLPDIVRSAYHPSIHLSIYHFLWCMCVVWFIWGWCVCVCVCVCSPGVWQLVSRFQATPQRTFTTEFEVKEYSEKLSIPQLSSLILLTQQCNNIYNIKFSSSLSPVLPSFEVKVEPRKTFFYVDDEILHVDLKAR